MYTYPKMKTLFKRDEYFKVTDEISCKEFQNINKWLVTEKIDGTNVRVIYHPKDNQEYRNNPATLSLWGKKDTSDMPTYLLERLNEMFDLEKFIKIFPEAKRGVCLYGEGYGAKIRSGGNYNKGHNFRLFDVWVDGWWLDWNNVEDVAGKLGIKTAPTSMITNMQTIVEIIKRNNFLSEVAMEEGVAGHRVEGVVARAYPMVLFRDKTPVKWKLKVKDYPPLDTNGVRLTAEEHARQGGFLMKEGSEILKGLTKKMTKAQHDCWERIKDKEERELVHKCALNGALFLD